MPKNRRACHECPRTDQRRFTTKHGSPAAREGPAGPSDPDMDHRSGLERNILTDGHAVWKTLFRASRRSLLPARALQGGRAGDAAEPADRRRPPEIPDLRRPYDVLISITLASRRVTWALVPRRGGSFEHPRQSALSPAGQFIRQAQSAPLLEEPDASHDVRPRWPMRLIPRDR